MTNDKSKADQIKDFRKTARALECDESEERFDAALKRVSSAGALQRPTETKESPGKKTRPREKANGTRAKT